MPKQRVTSTTVRLRTERSVPQIERRRPARIVVTLAVVGITGIGAASCAQAAPSATTTDETFTLNPGSSMLDVNVDRGQVLFSTGTGDRVQVRRTVRGGARGPAVEERADTNGASLRSRCPALSGRSCSISYEIAVPSGYVIDVAANTARVEVHGLTVEKLQVEGSSGSTHMEDVKGSVEIDSGSGSVTGTRLGLSEFVARVGSGRTSVDFALPPDRVAATTVSGAVTIRLPAGGGPYRVVANSRSGEEAVQVPTDPASSRLIDVSSSSGAVHVLPQ